MDIKTASIHNQIVDKPIHLHTPDDETITIHLDELTLTTEDDAYTECKLSCTVTPELYQKIDREGLFNLNPIFRHDTTEICFAPDRNIEIEARLDNEFLPDLSEYILSVSDATLWDTELIALHLIELSQAKPNHSLLFTESWFGLYVKQEVPLPSDLAGEGSSLKEGYSTKWAQDSAFTQTTDLPTFSRPIYDLLVNYFTNQGILFAERPENLVIHLSVQGENGKWNCYADAQEQQEQVLIYSIFPYRVPVENRLAMAEFLTRANYGLRLGCFEMDFTDGEIRFRTSLDVEGDRLHPLMLNTIVQINWSFMDKYFPGLIRVGQDGGSPNEAIQMVEADTLNEERKIKN